MAGRTMAKASANDTAAFVSGRSVQCHGGIGVTWGYHDRSALTAASCIIETFDQLPNALAGMWN